MCADKSMNIKTRIEMMTVILNRTDRHEMYTEH